MLHNHLNILPLFILDHGESCALNRMGGGSVPTYIHFRVPASLCLSLFVCMPVLVWVAGKSPGNSFYLPFFLF